MLRKPTEASFQRFGRYEIVDPGKWTTRTGRDRIEFVHELKDGAGYAYAYRKVLRLDGDTLVIEHELKNTGTKPILTSVYNHNFFTLDRKTTGPDNLVRFPFAPKASRPLNGMAEIRGRELAIARVSSRRSTSSPSWRASGPPRRTMGSRWITGDRRASASPAIGRCRSCCSGRPTRRCARSPTSTPASPGRTTSWRLTYTFYEVKPVAGAPR